jgi:hypothetical protein
MNPFTVDELFPLYHDGSRSLECSECGAGVLNRDTHIEWHNKVADL